MCHGKKRGGSPSGSDFEHEHVVEMLDASGDFKLTMLKILIFPRENKDFNMMNLISKKGYSSIS